jgi:hypothetical protein
MSNWTLRTGSSLLGYAVQAVVGQDVPFDHGRQQMKLLADLEVTTKAVERTAEAIGEDIAAAEQKEIQRAVQLDLPMVFGSEIAGAAVQTGGTTGKFRAETAATPRSHNTVKRVRPAPSLGNMRTSRRLASAHWICHFVRASRRGR